MKKLFVPFIMIIALFLSSCSKDLYNSNIETPRPTEIATPIPSELINDSSSDRIIVNIEEYTSQLYAPDDDSNCILSFYVQTPHVYIENNELVSSRINSYFETNNQKYFSNTSELSTTLNYESIIQSEALDNYSYCIATNSNVDFNFLFERIVNVNQNDNSLVFSFTDTSSTNEIITNTQLIAFDLINGEIIDFEKLDKDKSNHLESSFEISIENIIDNKSLNNIIDLVEIDDDGDDYLISIDGTVYNFKIYNSQLYENNDLIKLVWYSNYLDYCSIQVKSEYDGFPKVLIEFEDYLENNYSYYVQVNPDTGKLEVVDSNQVIVVG